MQEVMVETKINDLVPVMKVLSSKDDIPIPSVLSVKADGELSYLHYNRVGFSFTTAQAYTLNKWGKLRTDFPALHQFITAMNKTDVQTAELLCETFALEDGRPLMLPQFLHHIKGKEKRLDLIRMGIFDLLRINGEAVLSRPFLWKYETVETWLFNAETSNVFVLPYMQVKSREEIDLFWNAYVEDQHFEGLVVRTRRTTYKVKPIHELDAVIIAINKKTSSGKGTLFAQNQVTSLKLALMTPQGNFVEVGDVASGINHKLRSALWKLMDYKIAEDDKAVWVKPIVICTIQYNDLYKGRNKILKLTPEGYRHTDYMQLTRFRHPRLTGFRPDKQVTPQDLRIQQIPQQYIEEET